MTKSAASLPIERVTYSAESYSSASKHFRGLGPFLDVLREVRIQCIRETRVGNVKFVGVDVDD